jgi:hypothetical protein
VSVNDVQRVMGHEQASTTLDRFTHPSPDGNRRVLGGLDAFSLRPADDVSDPAENDPPRR